MAHNYRNFVQDPHLIQRRGPYDGVTIDLTRDCAGCKSVVKFKDKQICTWGIAFKYLVQPSTNMRSCAKLRRVARSSSGDSSEYVKSEISRISVLPDSIN